MGNSLDKPHDTACKGSSALVVAADRSMCAEIAVRNGKQVCGSFFDLQKFFDSVSPQALYDSICETKSPMINGLMGLQMHMAPRTIVLNTIPSFPFQVHTSILAGCIYSVPMVKALMHQGSAQISSVHPMFKTYVDDTANVASGNFAEVQAAIVECALAFNKLIVCKRRFVLSPKSIVVANSVASELAQYGIVVQVSNSTRDVGVMYCC